MPIEVTTLTDSATGSRASVAPHLGFNCFSFAPVVAGRPVEVLWHDPQFREGNTRPSRSGIPILFPFAGRIPGGRYRYRGRDYELEATDGRGNAIHGFVYTRPWRVVAQSVASVTGEFQASVDDPAILSRWPSDFRIRATYEVRGAKLRSSYEFTNTGNGSLPWWFGTHPYFKLAPGGGSPEEAIVRFAVDKQWELKDLIPTGNLIDVGEAAAFARGVRVGAREFDNAFQIVPDGDGNWSGSITNPTSGLQTTIRFGRPFRECVVFIPPHREAICLEPYSGVPNGFELTAREVGAGLRELQPGESCQVRVEVEVSSNDGA